MAYGKLEKLDSQDTLSEINRLADYTDAQQTIDDSQFVPATGDSTVAGIKTFSSMFRIPVGADVAAAGTIQSDAALLVEGFQVVTGANGTVGVRLPVAAVGAVVIIKGTTAGVLKVWPDTGAQINAVGANTAFSLASGAIPAIFIKKTATQWYSIPLVPS